MLHELKFGKIKRKKKRIGRGGKRGTTSGRGTKGQKSRAGHRIRPAERDLILRIPKRRGFRNKPKSEKPVAVKIGKLNDAIKPYFAKGGDKIVSVKILKEIGLIGRSSRNVKILDGGEISFPITLKGVRASGGAVKKIEAAGGRVEK